MAHYILVRDTSYHLGEVSAVITADTADAAYEEKARYGLVGDLYLKCGPRRALGQLEEDFTDAP